MFELWCRPEISRSLPSGFVHVDRKIPERSSRTVGSLLARTALLARSDIAERAVPLIASAVVQLLACRADVTIAIRQVGKALRTIEETPRSGERLSLARPQRYSCGYQPGSCCNTPCVPACRLSSHTWSPDRWRTP